MAGKALICNIMGLVWLCTWFTGCGKMSSTIQNIAGTWKTVSEAEITEEVENAEKSQECELANGDSQETGAAENISLGKESGEVVSDTTKAKSTVLSSSEVIKDASITSSSTIVSAEQTKALETQQVTADASEATNHNHTWVPVTTVVHHDATYKTVWVQDSAAWDETVVTKEAWDEQVLVQSAYDENVLVQDAYDEPIYEWVGVCNACGHKFLDPNEDIDVHMGAGCWSSWHDEWMQVGSAHHDAVYQTVHHEASYQTVHYEAETTVVHHEATGHNEEVIDQAAWDETATTGFQCSVCGEVK